MSSKGLPSASIQPQPNLIPRPRQNFARDTPRWPGQGCRNTGRAARQAGLCCPEARKVGRGEAGRGTSRQRLYSIHYSGGLFGQQKQRATVASTLKGRRISPPGGVRRKAAPTSSNTRTPPLPLPLPGASIFSGFAHNMAAVVKAAESFPRVDRYP